MTTLDNGRPSARRPIQHRLRLAASATALDRKYRSAWNALAPTTALRAPSAMTHGSKRRSVGRIAALLAGAMMTIQPVQAQSIFGFESGNLIGWTTAGSTAALGSDSITFETGSTFAVAAHQNYMARIAPTGANILVGAAESLLGLSAGAFVNTGVAAFQHVSNFGLITQSRVFDVGTYSFAWSYAAQDYTPYDDGVFFSLVGGGTAEIRVLAGNVTGQEGSIIVGSYGSTPWRMASFTISEAGTYQIGFGAYNWEDTGYDPILFIDDAPGSLTENGEAVPPDVDPPTTPTIDTAQPSYAVSALVAGTVLPTFDGGTLRIDAGGSYAQALTINAAGGTVDTDGKDATLSGVISGAGALTKAGAGTLTLSGTNNYAGATTVNAGKLSVASDGSLGAGALTLAGDTTLAVTGSTTIDNAVTLSGSATIDTSGSITAGLSGVITGTDSLTKAGAGWLTLSGDSSAYTGAISVDAGRLTVNGQLGGAVTVAGGATLKGHGTIAGAVTIADEGRLAVGNDVGTLTVGSLALAGGAILDYDLDTAGVVGGGVNDLIAVTGNVTLDGTLNISNAGEFGAGVYRLINYGGTLTDNGLRFGKVPGDDTTRLSIQTSVGGEVNLVNATGYALNFWDGAGTANDGVVSGGSGVWSATGGNWTDSDGTINAPSDAGLLVFQGKAGTVTVAGPVGFTGLQFAADGYRIEGDALTLAAATPIRVGDGTLQGGSYVTTIASNLTGAGTLVKTDLGTLILTGANSYTGGTVVDAGTLQVSADANLGTASGALTLAGGTLRYGAGFETARGVTLGGAGGRIDTGGHDAALTGTVSGSGGLIKAGAGTLTLSGSNSYTGGTTVLAGTLIGSADSIRGAIVNDGTVIFNQATDARFDGAISGTGLMVKQGAGVLTLAAASQQDWKVDQGGLAGSAALFGGNIAIGANGGLTFEQTGDATFAGALSGTGAFTKRGAGMLTLSGDGSGYTGSTTITEGGILLTGALASNVAITPGGTLQVGDGGTRGHLTGATVNNGTLIFARSDDYDYTGALSGNGSLVKKGDGLLLLSGDYNYTGSTVVQGGRVQLASALNPETDLVIGEGTFDLDGRDQTVAGLSGEAGTLLFGGGALTVTQEGSSTFGGSLSGHGSFIMDGAGSLNLTGDSDFAGPTFINGGRLAVNGTLASVVTANSGGTIGGNGTFGGLIVRNGGTASPGNSIGTLHVAGNVTFEAGSAYDFEVNGLGASDHIVATGTATLDGGTVNVLAANGGTFRPLTRYTILTAAAEVTGQFANATTDLAFLSPYLSYDATNVYLTLIRNDVDFTDIATTANQRSAAGAVHALGNGSSLPQQIIELTAADANNAFDQLSGEVHASARAAMIEDTRLPRLAVLGRLSQTDPTRDGAWMQAFGNWSDSSKNGNAARTDRATTGLLIGLDTAVGGHWRFGFAGGHTRADLEVRDRGSDGDVTATHVLGYAGAAYGPVRIKAGVGYAHADLDIKRNVAFAAFTDSLRARYDGALLQGFGEISIAAPLAGGTIEPFAGLAAVHARTHAFKETGGEAALAGAKRIDSTEWSTLGLRVATPVSGAIFGRASAAWQHRFGDAGAKAGLAFASGSPFQVSGNPLSRDSLSAETEIGWHLSRSLTLQATYAGTIGNGSEDHAVQGAITFAF